jgi:hypothetical protein
MIDHEEDHEWRPPTHSGIESYATNPGQVTEASGLKVEKDERVPNPFKFGRKPVVPQPAIPVQGGRPAAGYIGGTAPMSPEALKAKFLEELEVAETEVKPDDVSGSQI